MKYFGGNYSCNAFDYLDALLTGLNQRSDSFFNLFAKLFSSRR